MLTATHPIIQNLDLVAGHSSASASPLPLPAHLGQWYDALDDEVAHEATGSGAGVGEEVEEGGVDRLDFGLREVAQLEPRLAFAGERG